MDRRAFLSAAGTGLALMAPELAFARTAAGRPDWALVVEDVMADVPTQDLKLIHGRAPAGFAGTLWRNGPARFRRPGGDAGHWFDGDGLVRAFRLRDGKASVTARFVDTEKRRRDEAAGAVITGGFGTKAAKGSRMASADDANAANISVLPLGGEILALWEGGSPFVIDADTLATKGPKTFRADLKAMPMIAHPRIEPDGTVWNLGVSGKRAVVWRLSAAGAVEQAEMIQLPRASYVHDFTATERELILVLQPWIQDRMVMPYKDSFSWRPADGTQVLVLDKADLTKRRIYELPALFAFHFGDAWSETDGTIRFDACVSGNAEFAADGGSGLLKGIAPPPDDTVLALITLRANGKAEMVRTALPAEFPRSDPRLAGRPRSLTFVNTINGRDGIPFLQGVGRFDWRSGKTDSFDFGAHQVAEEFVFVPGQGSKGWLIGTTINLKARATELHLFDADRIAAGPRASWRAGLALPMGFHGAFVGAA